MTTHQVTRSSGGYSPPARRTRVTTPVRVVGWISPNARCPVCGAAVYFYGNQNGSRVFFDDLGPPWPKHPCTDNGTAPVTGSRAPSRHDFSLTPRPVHLRNSGWKPYEVTGVTIEDDRSRISLRPLGGSGTGATWTVRGRLSLRVDDLVFVRNTHLAYFDVATGEPAIAENDRRAEDLAKRLITERDRQHVVAHLDADRLTPERLAAVQAARTRGDLARALGIEVTRLRVAPPRAGDLWMLAIGFTLMVGAIGFLKSTPAVVMMLSGLLLSATAVYRLNPDVERGPRVVVALFATLLMLCPAGVVGAVLQP
ncbi:hypothetical protein [Actinoplanes xinjiangensis]|uniref:hypothetical protein n=1 Tax=Actinoplanes xinjiangensis TaxID=512350 RepID=UPI003440C768